MSDSPRVVPWAVGGHKEKWLGFLVGPSGPLSCIRTQLFST